MKDVPFNGSHAPREHQRLHMRDGDHGLLDAGVLQQAELLVRIRCHLRRYLHLSPPSPAALKVGGITLDDDARAVTVNDKPVSLTPLEYDILKFLMQHPCKVFSPQEIYRQVWREPPAAENSVAVHIRHIREKIEVDPSNPRYVTVVWGKGYKIEAGV